MDTKIVEIIKESQEFRGKVEDILDSNKTPAEIEAEMTALVKESWKDAPLPDVKPIHRGSPEERAKTDEEILALVKESVEKAGAVDDDITLESLKAAENNPLAQLAARINSQTLREIQDAQAQWQLRNFGPQEWNAAFLGMVEEMGELSHAFLKQTQGIRGTFEEHEAAAQDAVGDLLIFTLALCNARGWSAQAILEKTWGDVSRRDWVRFPGDGLTK